MVPEDIDFLGIGTTLGVIIGGVFLFFSSFRKQQKIAQVEADAVRSRLVADLLARVELLESENTELKIRVAALEHVERLYVRLVKDIAVAQQDLYKAGSQT